MSSRTGLTGVEMADGTVLMYPCSNRRRGAASGPATGLGKMTSGMAPSLVRSTSRVFEEAMFRQLIAAPPPGSGKMPRAWPPPLVRRPSRVLGEAFSRNLTAAPPQKGGRASLDEADQQTSNVGAWQPPAPEMQASRHRVGASR